MASLNVTQERLRSALVILEEADLAAVLAKQQVARIAGIDYQPGNEIVLLQSLFLVEGVEYRARVTIAQRNLIQQAAANGTTQEVLDLVTDNILSNHIYAAVESLLDVLVRALNNTDLTQLVPPSWQGSEIRPRIGGPSSDRRGLCLHKRLQE